MSKNKKMENKNLKIVGIGASASGLQALETFFSNCPIDSGFSFIVIQHLSPDFKSMHLSLLARKTDIPVSVTEDSMEIEPNHIYLIPENKNIILRDDKLQLLDRAPIHALNLPIDIFFNSLASEKKENAIGIILSGSGSDGTKGAAAIKEAGGVIFAQNPNESGFSGMPLSVINANLADFVLNVGEIPNDLLYYLNDTVKIKKKEEEIVVDEILEILKNETKYDFSAYRRQTLNRRIIKRKKINKLNKIRDYQTFLEKNESEQDILVNEFLIGVTSFFRDKTYFQTLKEKVIPSIIAQKKEGDIIKLWTIGCDTGEEAYSLAILMKEALKLSNKNLDFKIFATDINVKAIEKASKGFFGQNIATDIEPEYLAKYFKAKEDGFAVQSHLRKHIVFSIHDILHNPPFNKMDLVSCRNLLIYFQDSAQAKTIKSILYSLNLNGYLFLGSSESLGGFSKHFEIIDRRAKIFTKRLDLDNTKSHYDIFSTKIDKLPSKKLPEFASELTAEFTKKLALVTNSVCICINENIQVLEAYGNLRMIGSLPLEGFSTNLLKLLPKEFHIPIATSIRILSKSTNGPEVIKKVIPFNSNGNPYIAKIIFDRFDQRSYPHEKFYIIAIKVEESAVENISLPISDQDAVSDVEIQQLQNLLEDTRENLQLTIEELESSNEEAQATNEELVSSNEELQSTNEELQSVNEELYTVNVELQEKNIQLLELNSDIENLINSSHIATLFLDTRLHIRRFSPSLTKIINLRESDIGRSITNFSLPDSRLLNDVNDVNQNNTIHRKEILVNKKTWYIQEIHSYVSSDEKTRGTVINYTNINELKQVSLEIEEKSNFLHQILQVVPKNIFLFDLEKNQMIFSNFEISPPISYTPEELYKMEEKILETIVHPDDLESLKAHHNMMKKVPKDETHTIQYRIIKKDKGISRVESLDKPFEIDEDGTVKSILGFMTQVDEKL
jgi:two-component system CheB/CheR fusion protein